MMVEKIVAKCLSGKFFLVVIVGVTFAYVACKGIITSEATVGIISAVITHYFNKRQPEKGGDNV